MREGRTQSDRNTAGFIQIPQPHQNEATIPKSQWNNNSDSHGKSTHGTKQQHDNKYDILFLHDSICHNIDIHKLLNYKNRQGQKKLTSTSTEAYELFKTVEHANTTILHVGINDLKRHDRVEDAFNNYENLVELMKSKTDEIVLSLVTPCKPLILNEKVTRFNKLVADKYGNAIHNQIRISYNSNFMKDGRIIPELFEDHPTHLSRNHGIRLLAGNIKHCSEPKDKGLVQEHSMITLLLVAIGKLKNLNISIIGIKATNLKDLTNMTIEAQTLIR